MSAKRRLKNVDVEELSLVDKPAVPQAKFIIAKREEKPGEWWITQEEMKSICPDCAKKMRALRIKKLNARMLKQMPEQMLTGLCDKFGGEEGFRTRCMEGISDEISDKGAFCNFLEDQCHGTWKDKKSKAMHDSYESHRSAIQNAFAALSGPHGSVWLRDFGDDWAVVDVMGKCYKYAILMDESYNVAVDWGSKVEVASAQEWVEVGKMETAKAGRVLSRANFEKVKSAMAALKELMESAGMMEDEEEDDDEEKMEGHQPRSRVKPLPGELPEGAVAKGVLDQAGEMLAKIENDRKAAVDQTILANLQSLGDKLTQLETTQKTLGGRMQDSESAVSQLRQEFKRATGKVET